MPRLSKKAIILSATVLILTLSLMLIFIYQYKNGFTYITLNEAKKSNEEVKESRDNTDNEENKSEDITEVIEAEKAEHATTERNFTSSYLVNWWEYPDEILETEKDGDNLLVLVTKKYKLPPTYAPLDLVKANNSGIRRGENYYVRNILINDLTNLVNDISAEGIDISIVSGYRSYATQESTYQYWVNYNGGSTEEADKISARAGHSQHQLGTAIDFSTNGISDSIGSQFTGTEAQKWLADNAYKYGFALSYPYGGEEVTGYSYESWHYRYIGVDNALEWKNSGLILDQWLETR